MNKLIVTLAMFVLACTSSGSDSVVEMPVEIVTSLAAKNCGKEDVWLQVLGSGGPEIDDKRASTSYLLWFDGQAKILIDTGPGTAVNFEKTGANFSDLEMILFSHFHVDHSADLPAYIKGSFFGNRRKDLQISGPKGNAIMPGTKEFVHRLLADTEGAFQYLGDYLPNDVTRPAPYQIDVAGYTKPLFALDKIIKAQAVPVRHGPNPALAWRIDINDSSILFSGDMGHGQANFIDLLKSVDLFVAHNAIPESFKGGIRNLHMPPSIIGEYAADAGVNKLLLSHRMNRTLGNEDLTLKYIKEKYQGVVLFADDLDCYQL